MVRAPQRLNAAVDSAFKTVIAYVHAYAMAARIAESEGLTGEAWKERYTGMITDPHSEAWGAAHDEALRGTFQEKLPGVGEVVLSARRKIPGIRYKLVFFTSPFNLIRMGLKKTALGTPRLAWKLGRLSLQKLNWGNQFYEYDKSGRFGLSGTRQAVIYDIAEQALGWPLTMLFLHLVAPDEETGLPWITGTMSRDRGQRAAQYAGAPSMSFRAGTKEDGNPRWISYKSLSPVDLTIAATVDMINGVLYSKSSDDQMAALGKSMTQVSSLFFDQSSMAGLRDIFDMMFEPVGKQSAKAVSSFVSGWVPNIIRAPLRASDETIRESAVDDLTRFGFWGKSLLRGMQRGLPVPAEGWAPAPKVDWLGNEIKRGSFGLGKAFDFTARLLMPLTPAGMPGGKDTRLGQMIYVWNLNNPDNQFRGAAPPRKRLTHNGVTIVMSDDEYHEFMLTAGKETRRMVIGRHFPYAEPKERHIDMLKNAVSSGRAKAKRALIQKIQRTDSKRLRKR